MTSPRHRHPTAQALPAGLLSALAACLFGCPPPPVATVSTAPVVVTPVAPEPSPPPTLDPPEPTSPLGVTLPASPACILEGAWLGHAGPTTLATRPDGPVFANVSGGTGRLHIVPGPRTGMQGLEIEADGIAVRGWIPADATNLRAAKPFWLSGLALPTVYTLFQWTEAKEGTITVTTDSPNGLEVLSPPLSASRPCADLALGRGAFEPQSEIDGFAKAKNKVLTLSHPVPLSLDPKGRPVAQLHPDKDSDEVLALEVHGTTTRIAWNIGALWVVGWVASRDLAPLKQGVGFGTGRGRISGRKSASHHLELVCPADVPLLTDIGDHERTVVGAVRKGTVIEVLTVKEEMPHVQIRSDNITPGPSAFWRIPATDLGACQARTP